MEHPGHELTPMWGASAAGGGLAYYATVLAPPLSFGLLCLYYAIGLDFAKCLLCGDDCVVPPTPPFLFLLRIASAFFGSEITVFCFRPGLNSAVILLFFQGSVVFFSCWALFYFLLDPQHTEGDVFMFLLGFFSYFQGESRSWYPAYLIIANGQKINFLNNEEKSKT